MENATQALLMAAGVLIGVLILTLGIYLFYMFGNYASTTQDKITANQLSQFNDKFLKYDGFTNLTIQDVITVKNYALENNNQVANYNWQADRARANNDYIDVYYGATLLFGKADEELLIQEFETTFICTVKINSQTGRVNEVIFTKNNDE